MGLGIVAGRRLLEAGQRPPGDEHGTMQAQETVGELLFETGQRLVEQIFARHRAGGDVFEVGPEIKHFVDRHQ